MTRRTALVPGLALLLAWSAALLAASGAETAPVSVAKSPWRLWPGAKTDGFAPVLTFGWAADRVWVTTPTDDLPILRSMRLAGGRLTSVEATRIPNDHPILFPIVDGELVLNGAKGADGYFTAPLLANGRLGALKAVPDDLLARAKEAAAKVDSVGIDDGVRVGDRIVWLLGAGQTVGLGGNEYRLVCCSTSGAAVDLTRFIDKRYGVLFAHIGRDARGRIWAAWLDHRDYPHAARGHPTMLELDPATLAPRSKAAASSGVVADKIAFACASSCRLVAQTAKGDVVAWAPGERSPTRVASHWERGRLGDHPMWLLAASYRSGRLAVAYHGVKGKTLYDLMAPDTLRVVVGDARGARARVVASIRVANQWPPDNPSAIPAGPTVYGTFVPAGLVAVETFQLTRGNSSPLPYAFLPLRR